MGRVKRGRKRELRFLEHWAQHLIVTIIFDLHNTTEGGNIIFISQMKKGPVRLLNVMHLNLKPVFRMFPRERSSEIISP